MDDKSRPERLAAVGNIAEEDAGKQAADRLQFRLAEMQQDEGNHLDEDAAFFKFIFQPEKQKTPKHVFNRGQTETIDQEIVNKIEIILLVVFLQRRDE
jgi:hypothetical protein